MALPHALEEPPHHERSPPARGQWQEADEVLAHLAAIRTVLVRTRRDRIAGRHVILSSDDGGESPGGAPSDSPYGEPPGGDEEQLAVQVPVLVSSGPTDPPCRCFDLPGGAGQGPQDVEDCGSFAAHGQEEISRDGEVLRAYGAEPPGPPRRCGLFPGGAGQGQAANAFFASFGVQNDFEGMVYDDCAGVVALRAHAGVAPQPPGSRLA